MNGWEYFVGVVMPYIAMSIFVIAAIYKVIRWATAPKNLDWELFPVPESKGKQIAEMLREIIVLYQVYNYNRKIWFQSLLLHYGLYALGLWLVLTVIGVNVYYLGVLGAVGVLIGSVLLFLTRLSNSEMKMISNATQYINLLLLMITSGLALYADFFNFKIRDYFLSILTGSPNYQIFDKPEFFLALFFVEIFVLYLPLSSMVHFFAKYYTWDKIRWGGSSH
ncbi:Nitrate reductase gamma subunit [Archaeoglobus sulfaticallidus PM70-1]|uniref:Nitrate reductase gamma subunit n=1 Tax=Archaeoglobus sulfaticallidus PM70-1 TaxID=387631 RepID=N0BEP0_9EURY|nr:respiratory nitrate reductase subunit gamma [Archaeoglobus sulfaticallidus]AGK62094.1 Nitrate reductase gamma subunit [Archaeoglobus sulfaticallidus PM70-1]